MIVIHPRFKPGDIAEYRPSEVVWTGASPTYEVRIHAVTLVWKEGSAIILYDIEGSNGKPFTVNPSDLRELA